MKMNIFCSILIGLTQLSCANRGLFHRAPASENQETTSGIFNQTFNDSTETTSPLQKLHIEMVGSGVYSVDNARNYTCDNLLNDYGRYTNLNGNFFDPISSFSDFFGGTSQSGKKTPRSDFIEKMQPFTTRFTHFGHMLNIKRNDENGPFFDKIFADRIESLSGYELARIARVPWAGFTQIQKQALLQIVSLATDGDLIGSKSGEDTTEIDNLYKHPYVYEQPSLTMSQNSTRKALAEVNTLKVFSDLELKKFCLSRFYGPQLNNFLNKCPRDSPLILEALHTSIGRSERDRKKIEKNFNSDLGCESMTRETLRSTIAPSTDELVLDFYRRYNIILNKGSGKQSLSWTSGRISQLDNCYKRVHKKLFEQIPPTNIFTYSQGAKAGSNPFAFGPMRAIGLFESTGCKNSVHEVIHIWDHHTFYKSHKRLREKWKESGYRKLRYKNHIGAPDDSGISVVKPDAKFITPYSKFSEGEETAETIALCLLKNSECDTLRIDAARGPVLKEILQVLE